MRLCTTNVRYHVSPSLLLILLKMDMSNGKMEVHKCVAKVKVMVARCPARDDINQNIKEKKLLKPPLLSRGITHQC